MEKNKDKKEPLAIKIIDKIIKDLEKEMKRLDELSSRHILSEIFEVKQEIIEIMYSNEMKWTEKSEKINVLEAKKKKLEKLDKVPFEKTLDRLYEIKDELDVLKSLKVEFAMRYKGYGF